MDFKVILLPVSNRSDIPRVIDGLVEAFSISVRDARELIDSAPVALKTRIDHEAADNLVKTLQGLGIPVEKGEMVAPLVLDQEVQSSLRSGTNENKDGDGIDPQPSSMVGRVWRWLVMPMLTAEETTRGDYWGSIVFGLFAGFLASLAVVFLIGVLFPVVPVVVFLGHVVFYVLFLRIAGPEISGAVKLKKLNVPQVSMYAFAGVVLSSLFPPFSLFFNGALLAMAIFLGLGLPGERARS